METWLGHTNPASLGATGLLAIFVLMLFLGKLVPISQVRQKEAEAERWRQLYEIERKRGDSLVQAVANATDPLPQLARWRGSQDQIELGHLGQPVTQLAPLPAPNAVPSGEVEAGGPSEAT